MAKAPRLRNADQSEIVKVFNRFSGKYSRWELWSDFITLTACTISNAVDVSHREKREKLYMTVAGKYTKQELDRFAEILARLVDAYDSDPDQDLLGELYMALELGNDNNGQFFTPYDICRCMAAMNLDNASLGIQGKGWISVNDPAVGAGALLIAFANECHRRDINYQQHVLFTAQDIDMITALMCYIQISLLGCPGYVYVGNTLTDPCQALDSRGLIPRPSDKLWYTPMYFAPVWHYRCLWYGMDILMAAQPVKAQAKPPAASAGAELTTTESGQLALF